VDRADRSAATVRSVPRIDCSLASSCANINHFLPGRDIDEGQLAAHNGPNAFEQGRRR